MSERMQDRRPPSIAWPLGRRGRLTTVLTSPFDGGAPLQARFQPGVEAFPKQAFELERDDPRAPEGQSLAYLRLLRRLWLELWARQEDEPSSPREAWLRSLHAAVLHAHVLEREMIDRLGADR